MASTYLKFSDPAFACSYLYQTRYGCKNPYLIGVVLDAVFPANISISEREVFSLKVAVWQSPSSFGFVKVMGKRDELPKLTSRGQIIIVGKTRGKVETNYRGHSESIAVLPPQYDKHREVLLLSEHERDQSTVGLFSDDGFLVVDKYSITKNPFPVDGPLKDHLGELLTSFKSYDSNRDYCTVDPLKYVALGTCATLSEMRTRDMAHNHELNLAYCVAVWQNKEEDDDFAVELFDHSFPSLAEKKWPPRFAERYRRLTQVDCYNETTPTAIVRIPVLEYSKHYWHDKEAQWKRADCLMNIRKVNIDNDGMLRIVQKDMQAVSGYQGYDTIDADSPYGYQLKTSYQVIAHRAVRLKRIRLTRERLKRKVERRKMTPNEYLKRANQH